jgi:hypothetical protein
MQGARRMFPAVLRGQLRIAANPEKGLRKERRVQSLCEKHLFSVGDEVTSLKFHQKPPISGEK